MSEDVAPAAGARDSTRSSLTVPGAPPVPPPAPPPSGGPNPTHSTSTVASKLTVTEQQQTLSNGNGNGGGNGNGRLKTRPASVPIQPRKGWMKPTSDVEFLIQKHFAGGDPVADKQPDNVITHRIQRLATRPLRDVSQEKPTLQAIQNWGSWMSVKSAEHICNGRRVPRPASTPGLILTQPEKFHFDASQVKRRRKGRRFRGCALGLSHRKAIHAASDVPPEVGPGLYKTEKMGEHCRWREDLQSLNTQQLISQYRHGNLSSFTQAQRWKKENPFLVPGPGAYEFKCMFIEDAFSPEGYRQIRGIKFGPERSEQPLKPPFLSKFGRSAPIGLEI